MEAVLYIRTTMGDADVVYELLTPEVGQLVDFGDSDKVDWDAKGNPICSFGKFMMMHEYIIKHNVKILYETNELMED